MGLFGGKKNEGDLAAQAARILNSNIPAEKKLKDWQEFRQRNREEIRLQGQRITGICRGLNLAGISFAATTLQSAEFINCKLNGVSFKGAELISTQIRGEDDLTPMMDTDFTEASFDNSQIVRADLTRAVFDGARFQWAAIASCIIKYARFPKGIRKQVRWDDNTQ